MAQPNHIHPLDTRLLFNSISTERDSLTRSQFVRLSRRGQFAKSFTSGFYNVLLLLFYANVLNCLTCLSVHTTHMQETHMILQVPWVEEEEESAAEDGIQVNPHCGGETVAKNDIKHSQASRTVVWIIELLLLHIIHYIISISHSHCLPFCPTLDDICVVICYLRPNEEGAAPRDYDRWQWGWCDGASVRLWGGGVIVECNYSMLYPHYCHPLNNITWF